MKKSNLYPLIEKSGVRIETVAVLKEVVWVKINSAVVTIEMVSVIEGYLVMKKKIAILIFKYGQIIRLISIIVI